jgi:transcription elongation factor Elf1
MPLHLIKTQQPRHNKRAESPRPEDMLQCHRCGGREVTEAKIGVVLKSGKPRGGTKVLLCAQCGRSGERVVLA